MSLLYAISDSSIIRYNGKKYRVTDTKRSVIIEGSRYEEIYIYPYLPYAESNLSNEGIYLPSNIYVELLNK